MSVELSPLRYLLEFDRERQKLDKKILAALRQRKKSDDCSLGGAHLPVHHHSCEYLPEGDVQLGALQVLIEARANRFPHLDKRAGNFVQLLP